MRARDELILRCAARRSEELGGLSSQGFAELLLAVGADPVSFATHPEEQAFLELTGTIERFERDLENDDLLDDDAYATHAEERRQSMAQACQRICETTPDCLDAQTIAILMSAAGPDEKLDRLLDLLDQQDELGSPVEFMMGGDAWDDVFTRPYLRLCDAASRAFLETARFRLAIGMCEELLVNCHNDELGARRTMQLALARLEDEDRFYFVSKRHDEDAWYYLSNALLLYKLDRLPAARRALNGLATQCRGGAYALLRPIYVESYLPDRPAFEPGSFEEAVLAVHEADPIVVDCPDFINWASEQPGFVDAAKAFADREGFDW